MLYTYCIWDFNGTVLDDVDLGVYSVNTLLEKHQIELRLSKSEYRACFDFPIIDYYRKLGFDFEKTPYDILAKDWVEIYLDNLDRAGLPSDLISSLNFFRENGVLQSILSASENEMLNRQVRGLGIAQYFEDVMGIDNIYGDSKLAIARKWRDAHPEDKVIFIGDTTHDIETAKVLCADCYIVCAGHQCRERFADCNVKLFESLSELVAYLKELA